MPGAYAAKGEENHRRDENGTGFVLNLSPQQDRKCQSSAPAHERACNPDASPAPADHSRAEIQSGDGNDGRAQVGSHMEKAIGYQENDERNESSENIEKHRKDSGLHLGNSLAASNATR